MEEDERQKKLEVGREKFAAYQKKKKTAALHHGRSKEKNKKEYEDDASPASSAASTTSENVSEKSKSKIDELETILAVKDVAMQAMQQELEELRNSSFHSDSYLVGLSETDKDVLEKYQSRIAEFQQALDQRDLLIDKLSNSLALYQSDEEHLTQEMTLLKKQMQAVKDLAQSQHWETGIKPEDYLALTEKTLKCEDKISRQEDKIAELTKLAASKEEELVKKLQELREHKLRSSEEVQKLMREVEIMQQKAAAVEHTHKRELTALRSELEENFGLQLTQIKDELRHQHESEKLFLIQKYEGNTSQKHEKPTHLENLTPADQELLYVTKEKLADSRDDKENDGDISSSHVEELDTAFEMNLKLPPIRKADKKVLECLGDFDCQHKTKLESYEKKIESLNERLQEATTAEENFVKVLNAHKENYEEELSSSKVKLDEMETKLKQLLESEEKYLKVIDCKETEIITLREKLEEVSRKNDDLTESNDVLKNKIENLNNKLLEYEEYKEEAEKHKAEAKSLNERLTAVLLSETSVKEENISLKRVLEEMTRFKEEAVTLNERIQSLNKKLEVVTQENTSYQNQIQLLNSRLLDSTEAEKNHSNQISFWEGEINKYKEQLDVLVDSIKSIEEKHSAELKEIFLAHDKHITKLKGEFDEQLDNIRWAYRLELDELKAKSNNLKRKTCGDASGEIVPEESNKKVPRDLEVKLSEETAQRADQESGKVESVGMPSLHSDTELKDSMKSSSMACKSTNTDAQIEMSGELLLCKQQIKTLTSRLEESYKSDQSHVDEIMACQSELERYKQQVDYLDDRLSTELSASSDEIDELRSRVQELLIVKESNEQQILSLTSHIENIMAEVKEKSDKEGELLLELESCKNQLRFMNSAWNSSKSGAVDIKSLQEEMLMMQEQIETLNVQLQESVVSKERYIAKVDDLTKVVESYKDKLRQYETNDKCLKDECKTYQMQMNCLVMEKMDLQNHLSEMRRCEDNLRAEAAQTQIKLRTYQLQVEQQVSEINMMHDRELNELHKEIHNLNEVIIQKNNNITHLKKLVENSSGGKEDRKSEQCVSPECISELKENLQILTAEKLKLEALLAGREEVEQHWITIIEKYKTQLDELTRRSDSTDDMLADKDELNTSLTHRILGFEASNKELFEQNKELLSKVAKGKELLQRSREELEEAVKTCSKLENENEALKDENAMLKFQIHVNDVKKNEGICNEVQNSQGVNFERESVEERSILNEFEREKELIVLREVNRVLEDTQKAFQNKIDDLEKVNNKLVEELEQAWKICKEKETPTHPSLEREVPEDDADGGEQKEYISDKYNSDSCVEVRTVPVEVEELQTEVSRLKSEFEKEGDCRIYEGSLDINQKMELLLKSNTELVAERGEMLQKLRIQQDLINKLKTPGDKSVDLEDFSRRHEELVDELVAQHEKYTSIADANSTLQETLRRQKEELLEKLQKKGEVESELIKECQILNSMQMKLQSLEHQLIQKDVVHQELAHQKQILERDLRKIEDILKKQKDQLRNDKLKFEAELRSRDLSIRSWKLRAEVGKVNIAQPWCGDSSDSEHRMHALREELKAVHNHALARLKTHLTQQFDNKLFAILEKREEQLNSLLEVLDSGLKTLDKDLVLMLSEKNQWADEAKVLKQVDFLADLANNISKLKDECNRVIKTRPSSGDLKFKEEKQQQADAESAVDMYEDGYEFMRNLEQELCEEYASALKSLIDGWRSGCRKKLTSTLQHLDEAWSKEEVARQEGDLEAASQHQDDIASLLITQEQMFTYLQELQSLVEQFHSLSVEELHAKLEAGHMKVVEQIKKNGLARTRDTKDVSTETALFNQVLIEWQKDLELKHEKEMAELRTYFEQKCADVEKQYSEEIYSHHSRQVSGSSSDSVEELTTEVVYFTAGDNVIVPVLTHIDDSLDDKEAKDDVHAVCRKHLAETQARLREVKRTLDEKYCTELEQVKEQYDRLLEEHTHNTKVEMETLKRQLSDKRKELENILESHFRASENLNLQQQRSDEENTSQIAVYVTDGVRTLDRVTYEEMVSELNLSREDCENQIVLRLEHEQSVTASSTLDFWQLFERLKMYVSSLGALDINVLGLITELGIAHSIETKIMESDIKQKERKFAEEHEKSLQQVRLSCERRLQEQVEEARCDIVTMLRDYLQALLAEEAGCSPKSQELAVLEEKLLAPYKHEVAQLKQELEALKAQAASGDTQSQLSAVTKDRDDLIKLVTVLRCIIKELFEYFTQCEEELNTSFEESCLGNESTSDMSSTRRVHFAPDVSHITSILDENSMIEYTGEGENISVDIRNELDRCLKRLKGEAKAVFQLSRKLLQEKEVVSEGYGEQGEHCKSETRSAAESMTELREKAKALIIGETESPYSKILEEMCNEGDRLSEEARREREDLQQQQVLVVSSSEPSSDSGARHHEIEAADKQLKSTRQFLEEQAAERELERDDFLREIAKLEEKLKEADKDRTEHLQSLREMENMEQQLKELNTALTVSEERRDQLQAELDGALEKISTLREIIVELESSLESKCHLEQQVTQLHGLLNEQTESHRHLSEELEAARTKFGNTEYAQHVAFLEEQLQRHRQEVEQNPFDIAVVKQMKTQLRDMENTLERKTKELESLHVATSSISISSPSEDVSIRDHLELIRNDTPSPVALPVDDIHRLQDKLMRHSRAEEAAIKRVRDLEMQLRASKRNEEEVSAERDVLQERLEEQLLKISSLQARLDEQRRAANAQHAEVVAELQAEVRDRREEGNNLRQALDAKNKEMKQLQALLDKTRKKMAELELQWEDKTGEEVLRKDEGSQTSLRDYSDEMMDMLISDLKSQVRDLNYYRALTLTREQLMMLEDMKAGHFTEHYLNSSLEEEPDRLRDGHEEAVEEFYRSDIVHLSSALVQDKQFSLEKHAVDGAAEEINPVESLQLPLLAADEESAADKHLLRFRREASAASSSCQSKTEIVEKEDHTSQLISDLQKQLQDKDAERDKLIFEFMQKKRETDHLIDMTRQELEEKHDQLQDAVEKLSKAENLSIKLHQELTERDKELLSLKQKMKDAPSEEYVKLLQENNNQHLGNQEELERMREINKDYLEKLEFKQGELDELREYVCRVSEDYHSKLSEYEKLMEEHDGSQQKLKKLEDENEQLKMDLSVLQDNFRKFDDENKQLKIDLSALQDNRRKLEEENGTLQIDFSHLRDQLKKLEDENEKLRTDLTALRDQLKMLENDNAKLKTDSIDLKNAKDELEKACNVLKQKLDEMCSERSALMDELSCRGPGSLDELSHRIQRELEESAQLDMTLLEKLDATDNGEDTPSDSSLKPIFEKILRSGFDVLTLDELTLLHQCTLSATSRAVGKDLHSPKMVREAALSSTLQDEKLTLANHVDEMQGRLREQEEASEKRVREMERAVAVEREKVSELKKALVTQWQQNEQLRARVGSQADYIHDLEVQKELVAYRVSNSETEIRTLRDKLHREQGKVQYLERELIREKGRVSRLEKLLEEEKEKQKTVLDSSRVSLKEDALDSSTSVEASEKKQLAERVSEVTKKLGMERELVQSLFTEVCQEQERRDHFKAQAEEFSKELESLKKVNAGISAQMETLKLEMMKVKKNLTETQKQKTTLESQLQLARNVLLKSEEELKLVKEELETQKIRENDLLVEVAAIVKAGDSGPTESDDSYNKLLEKVRAHQVRLQEISEKSKETNSTANDLQEVETEVAKLEQLLSSDPERERRDAEDTEAPTSLVYRLKNANILVEQCVKNSKVASLAVSSLKRRCQKLQEDNSELKDRNRNMLATWEEEKATLRFALDEAEVNKYTQVPALMDLEGKLKLLTGKFLRAESYRKALIWQKRYLLIVLDGYQNSNSVLNGGSIDLSGAWYRNISRTPRQKFRSAVLAVIALSRMRYLVSRWRGNRLRRNALLDRLLNDRISRQLPVHHEDADRVPNNFSQGAFPAQPQSNFLSPDIVASLSSSQIAEYIERFDNIQQNLGFVGTTQTT